MIWLSLHPSPAGETSAFIKTRAFKSRRAGLFPFRIKPSSRSCSSALSRTTYLFTDFSRVAIVPSVARSVTEANHQILSNWLKRATSPVVMNMGAGDGQELPPREEPSTTHFHRLALDKALNGAAKLRKPFHLRPRLILL